MPVAWIAGRLARGIDIRDYGSGNAGASNVWQSVSKTLVVPVGLAQVAQGAAGVLVAKLLDQPAAVQVVAGIAAIVAHNWSPWLRFTGGRGVGPAIGVLLVLSPIALVVFAIIALAGVALRAIPQAILIAFAATPVAAAASGAHPAVVAGTAAVAAIVAIKRVLANAPPGAGYARPRVWLTRLVYDRDTPDRDAWVRRNLPPTQRGAAG